MSRLSFAECLARCREYGQEKTIEAQEKKKDQIRQQLAEKRKSYYQQMTTTVDGLQLGKRPDIIHYSGLYYREEKSHVQLQKLYGDMIQWVVDNKSQLLEETFPDVNVKVVDYNVNEKGNLVNIWFVLSPDNELELLRQTMRKERYLELDRHEIIVTNSG